MNSNFIEDEQVNNIKVPLSLSQEKFWVMDKINKGEFTTYNNLFVWSIKGDLNVELLELSLNRIVEKHEPLRTVFDQISNNPYQIIKSSMGIKIVTEDLTGISKDIIEEEISKLVEEERKEYFQLDRGPLLRIRLLKVDYEAYIFIVHIHHLIFDGWSLGVFIQELINLYIFFSEDKKDIYYEPLPIQYKDFTKVQIDWISSKNAEKQLTYWKKQLSGTLPVLQLPTDYPRPLTQSLSRKHSSMTLSSELVESLANLAKSKGVSLYVIFMTAFNVFLHRYTGQDDIIVGSPTANRNWKNVNELIGCFINTIPLRTKIDGNPKFSELINQVRTIVFRGLLNQELPLEKIVENVKPERINSISPLFQVMLTYQNAPAVPFEIPNLSIEPLPFHVATAPFDLCCLIREKGKQIQCTFEYDDTLFNEHTIERMLGNFQTLLENIIIDSEQQISEIPILTSVEQELLLVEWNNTDTHEKSFSGVHQMVENRASLTPEAIAVVDKERSINYSQLNGRANQLARYLQEKGFAPGQMVGVYTDRSIEMIISMLGIFKAGGVYVPLDMSYPSERLLWIIEDAKLDLVITTKDKYDSLLDQFNQVNILMLEDEQITDKEAFNLGVDIKGDQFAYVIYTSGSTGKPKGVLVPHQGLSNLVLWFHQRYKVETIDRGTQVARMGFDASMLEIWPFLTAGASLHIVDTEILLSPKTLKTWLIQNEITLSHLPPIVAEELLNMEWEGEVPLRALLTGSDRLRLLPPDNLPFKYVNHYGPTEYSVICISGEVFPNIGEVPAIGRPISNTKVYVLDQNLQLCPIGAVGELYVSGVGIAAGYLNQHELTEEKFINHPFIPGQKIYRTGDLVRYRHDGNMEFVGRVDYQVKLRGFRIELGEIEALLIQHPNIHTAVTIVREDKPGDKRLVAYVVPIAGRKVGTSEIKEYMRQNVPDYMVPSIIIFLNELPLSANDKIDRNSLPRPETIKNSEGEYTPASTDLELKLVNVWEKLLNISPIGTNDNFFELGGHSLLAITMIDKVKEEIFQNVNISVFLRAPTIRNLAKKITEKENSDRCLVQLKKGEGNEPPIFMIHPLGGGGLCYLPLIEELHYQGDIYALQAIGYDSNQKPLETIEEMSNYYLRKIREVQPQGPYNIIAWSFGGYIALQIIKVLESNGEKIKFFGLIDVMAKDCLSPLDKKDFNLKSLNHYVKSILDIGDLSLEEEDVNFLLNRAKSLGRITKELTADIVIRQAKLMFTNAKAIRNYQFSGKIRADISLFAATQESVYPYHPIIAPKEWEEITYGRVYTTHIDANHHNIVNEPHVKEIATNIQKIINPITI